MASTATGQSLKALDQTRENKKKQQMTLHEMRGCCLWLLVLTGENDCLLLQVSASASSAAFLPPFLPQTCCTPHCPQLSYTDYHLKDLMRGISLAMAGNAPNDSRVCDEDLDPLADVMLSDTCMHSQAWHQWWPHIQPGFILGAAEQWQQKNEG